MAASGTSILCSNPNNIQLVIPMIHSFWKVSKILIFFNSIQIFFASILSTFYTSAAPSTTKELPEDYVQRVKQIHESGGYESRGYEPKLPLYTF
jgi:hypothetical protein